jgi:hypothetical protein
VHSLEINLKGKYEITKPFFDRLNIEIFGSGEQASDGLFNKYRCKNRDEIKKFNKNELKLSWKNKISSVYLKNASRDVDSFEEDFRKFKENYEKFLAFDQIETEATEAYNEWYDENNIEDVTNGIDQLSRELKEKLVNEQRFLREKSELIRREMELAEINQRLFIMNNENQKRLAEMNESCMNNLKNKKLSGNKEFMNILQVLVSNFLMPIIVSFFKSK